MERSSPRTRVFWPVLIGVVIADIITKWLAVRNLSGQGPREVFGNAVRFTLVYNPGAAFGLNVGEYSRLLFIVLTLVALVILLRLYQQTRADDLPRALALGLVCAGALGNLLDRLRSPRGVVDFLDVGVAAWRWPTFNVADMAVCTGAFLLAWVLWGEDRAMQQSAATRSAEPAQATGER